MVINPKPDTASSHSENKPPTIVNTSDNKSATSVTNPITSKPPTSNIVLNNTYKDPKFKYQINYPSDWKFFEDKKGSVVFHGPDGTPSAQSSFLIQAFRYPRKHPSAKEMLAMIKDKISKSATDIKIIDEGVMPALEQHPKYEGQYAVYTYNIDNKPIGHLEIVSFSGFNRMGYILDYISSAPQFEVDLPIAKAMIISFASKK